MKEKTRKFYQQRVQNMNSLLASLQGTKIDTSLELQTENIYHNLQAILNNAQCLDPEVSYKLLQIDWQPLLLALQHHQKTKSWSWKEQMREVVNYALWLGLAMMYPHSQLAPTLKIDEVWHLHILSTEKYVKDCDYLFGYYLHHRPCFGLYTVSKQQELQMTLNATIGLFMSHFHISPVSSKSISMVLGACARPSNQ